jgi:hypothetical protein
MGVPTPGFVEKLIAMRYTMAKHSLLLNFQTMNWA